MMSAEFALSSEFWASFIEQYWAKRPVLLKRPFAALLSTPARLFHCLVQASDKFRAGDGSVLLRFLVEDQFILQGKNFGPYLPQSKDQSIAGYAQRITQQLGGVRFACILNDVQEHDAELWLGMREFLHRLLAQLPAQIAFPGVFLGNYEKTPFGIHTDPYAVFSFVIEGRKRIHLWPPSALRGRTDERLRAGIESYAKLLDEATTLEGEPGDIIYWPAGYWHVGESVGGLAASISLGLEPARPFEDVFDNLIERLKNLLMDAARTQCYSFEPEKFQESAATIPRVLEQIKEATRAVGQDDNLERALKSSWLNHLTGSGFLSVPPALPWKPLRDDDIVRGCPDYPIRWTPAADDEVICAANGHSFTIAAHPKILQLIERLNTGAAHQVQDLLAEHAGIVRSDGVEFQADAEEIRALLEKLYSLRALTDGA